MILAANRLLLHKHLEEFAQQGGWLAVVVIATCILILFALVVKLKDWMRPKGLSSDSPEEMLLQFRDIHRQGELSAEEYQHIRERLTKRSDESDRAGDASRGPSADDSAGSSPSPEL